MVTYPLNTTYLHNALGSKHRLQLLACPEMRFTMLLPKMQNMSLVHGIFKVDRLMLGKNTVSDACLSSPCVTLAKVQVMFHPTMSTQLAIMARKLDRDLVQWRLVDLCDHRNSTLGLNML